MGTLEKIADIEAEVSFVCLIKSANLALSLDGQDSAKQGNYGPSGHPQG